MTKASAATAGEPLWFTVHKFTDGTEKLGFRHAKLQLARSRQTYYALHGNGMQVIHVGRCNELCAIDRRLRVRCYGSRDRGSCEKRAR